MEAESVGSNAPFYVDPSAPGWQAPNLVAGLMAAPTIERLAPLERQATVVLAWLIDNSPVFATALLGLFFGDDDEALHAVRNAPSAPRARAWATLRKLPQTSGPIYPDLVIAGAGRAYELIVEIKIDAEVHSWDVEDGSKVYQPDAYLRSWSENYDPATEARIRRVGTLTKNGPGVPLAPHSLRAADVLWSDVRDLLKRLLEAGELEPPVAAVARDAVVAIETRIIPLPRQPQSDDPTITWGYGLLENLAPVLADFLADGSLRRGATISSDYAGAYVYFMSAFGERKLWLYVTPTTGRYHIPNWPASLWIGEEITDRWPEGLRSALQAQGVDDLKDAEGWRSHRFGIPIDDIQRQGDPRAQLQFVLEAARPRLAGLAPSSD